MKQMKCKPIEQDVWEKAKQRARDSFEDIGIMGSFVGLIEGEVVVNILNTEEILELLSLYDHINEIPKEYTFYLD